MTDKTASEALDDIEQYMDKSVLAVENRKVMDRHIATLRQALQLSELIGRVPEGCTWTLCKNVYGQYEFYIRKPVEGFHNQKLMAQGFAVTPELAIRNALNTGDEHE